jgi:Methyltransferase FkbM domain
VQEAAEPNKSTVRAWDVLSLLALAPGNAQQIDILKVDIEGSERQLFSATAQNWLPLVRNICIELHGPACEEVFWGAMAGYSYVKATSGELTLCSAIRRRTD